jgi:hypothetical protein
MDCTPGDSEGCAPNWPGMPISPSTTSFSSRPRPSTSTATTEPGATGREFAGVPVKMMSPRSKVIVRARSARR